MAARFYVDADRSIETSWIKFRCLVLSQTRYPMEPKARMYAGQKTPDGYFVGENGAWDRKEK